ncbi:helix-turn-helix domain-containing protein [Dyadobacter aurulentus]|uniref:helix-turn-helix domain-containing protein n=1 Tax=Dyadobacter sp. UC 10 TaxID=2605428 RepID=UPI0011F1AB93|nr:AraC family transcriptional regulator [Dyadobacter sp. UC 10]KAA0988897.1 helix-turn-helix transcriptional regulator [Dyadobacter sp. UC 10]
MLQTVYKSTFSLLNADLVKLDTKWSYKKVISPFYRLYLITGGHGCISDGLSSMTLEKGYIYLIPSFMLCNYDCDEYLEQYYMHIYEENPDGFSLFGSNRKLFKIEAQPTDLNNMKRIIELNPGRDLKKSHNPWDYEKESVIHSYHEMNRKASISSYLETMGIIMQMMSRFVTADHFDFPETKVIPSKILDTVNYIQTNLAKELTIEHLAERVHQNADYFSRTFQIHTGMRPINYIQHKRVERAQFMMLTSGMSLYEIAIETGFGSISYFSRVFKRISGQNPSDYKIGNHF